MLADMSEPGWYPDPGGDPGQFRYWNGQAWASETSASPGTHRTPSPPARESRSSLVVAVLAVVLLLVVGLVIWRANSPGGISGPWGGGEDTNSATPTVSAWDETSTATPSDEPPDSGGSAVPCPDTDIGVGGTFAQGRMQSGKLSVPIIESWSPPSQLFYLAGLSNVMSQYKTIVTGWKSDSALGTTSKTTFPTLARAAHALADCFASSGYYRDMTSVQNLMDQAVTIDGRPGHRIRANVYVDFTNPSITGDVIDVIVIDTGSPDTFGAYVSAVTIGDTTTQAEIDAVIADIRMAA